MTTLEAKMTQTNPVPVHGSCDPRFEVVREIFQRSFDAGDEIGASVAFNLDGEPVVDLWGGHYDEARTREWERDTIVNTYSTTKAMTALCAAQLMDQGKLEIEAPVASYWPEFAAEGKQDVTIRQLLNHTAGLPGPRELLPEGALLDWELTTSALARTRPWWTPGEKHGYHARSFGFLVGEVVRRISGESLGTYFRKHVAEPLGADFHIGLGAEHDARTSDLHGRGFVKLKKSSKGPKIAGPLGQMLEDMFEPTTMTGSAFNNPTEVSGAVNTRAFRAAEMPAHNGHGNARALARIYGALARGGEVDGVRILSPEAIARVTREEAFGPDAVLGGLPMRYGLGFMLRHDMIPFSPNPGAFGHAGAGGSIGMGDPEARVGFGFTMNRMQLGIAGSANGFEMVRAFFDAL
jgi:CubicO group peptidase (beta-lactamase class C family)